MAALRSKSRQELTSRIQVGACALVSIVVMACSVTHAQSPSDPSAITPMHPAPKDEQPLPGGALWSGGPGAPLSAVGWAVQPHQIDIQRIIEDFKRRNPTYGGGLIPSGPVFSPRDLTSQVPPNIAPITAPNIPPPLSGGSDRIVIAPSTVGAMVSPQCGQALEDYFPLAEQPVVNRPADLIIVNAMMDSCYGAGSPPPQRFEPLLRRTVIISDVATEKHGGRCTGFLLDASTVLTAAHCFDGRSEDNEFDIRIDPAACTGFWIVTAQGEKLPFAGIAQQGEPATPVTCPVATFSRAALDRDIVFARLASEATDPTTRAPFAAFQQSWSAFSLDPGTGLYVIGRNPFGHVQDAHGGAFLVDRTNACRVIYDPAPRGGAIVHQCLVQPGMSGGPMFAQTQSGALRLVGVHQSQLVLFWSCVHALAQSGLCTNQMRAVGFLNVGHRVSVGSN